MTTNSRVHACLDGELPRHLLSAAEEAELSVIEQDLGPLVHRVRALPPLDLRAAVMQRLPEEAPPLPWPERAAAALRAAWEWYWTPQAFSFQLRPSLASAALVVLLGLRILGALQSTQPEEPTVASAAEAPPILVQFRFDAAHATSVSLAGSFSEWRPAVELRESSPGVWTARVPLRPGVHDYLFLVDGAEWVPDSAARSVEDDFGGINSRLFLAPPTSAL